MSTPRPGVRPIDPGSYFERSAWLLLCLLVFTLPWEKVILFPLLGSLSRVAGIAAFAAAVLALWRRGALRRLNLALALGAVFILWTAASWLWSLDPAASAAKSFTLLQAWVMAWLFWEFARGVPRQRRLMAVYLGGAVLGAAIGIVRYALHLQTYYRRYAATGFDPNDFGLLLTLSLPMALYLGLDARGWKRILPYLAAAVVLSAILLTASRTALIASLVSFALIPWTWHGAQRFQRVASLALLAFLLLNLADFAPASSRDRLATIPEEVTTGSINSRKQIWKSGARQWLEHPWIGVGVGAYPEAVRPQLGTPTVPGARYVAHNTPLSVLVETGVIGFALWAAMLLTLATYIWMMPLPERAFCAVLLAAWFVGVSTLTWEHYKGTWLVFSLIMLAWPHAFLSRERTA